MIYGNVNNEFFEQQTAILAKPLRDALHFLKTADLANHEAGKFPMDLNGVPVIPMFYTFKTRKLRRDGTPKKSFTLHIGEPILPNPDAPLREEAERLAGRVWEFNKGTYERVYGKELEYD